MKKSYFLCFHGFLDVLITARNSWEIYTSLFCWLKPFFNMFNIILLNVNFLSIVKNCNHKRLGLYYLLSAFIFGISGTLFSIILRLELYASGNRIISPENQNFYNVTITLHGLLMIFFLVMPALFGGFGNYFTPIFQGSPEIIFPRINNFSILLLALSYLLVILSVITEYGAGTGWTLYPPLSTSFMSLSPSSIYFLIVGLAISGISSALTSLNFLLTITNMRVYSMSLKLMPLFNWSILITSNLLLMCLPILTGALIMVLSDLNLNTLFYDPVFGGDPVLSQHLFWFFGHPEVYILILPAFGAISHIISSVSQRIIFGNQSMIFAMSSISLLGSVVWGHHMYMVGLSHTTRMLFSTLTVMISVPAATKLMHWCVTIANSVFVMEIPLIFTFTFAFLFVCGGGRHCTGDEVQFV